jgi:hypothetical protein
MTGYAGVHPEPHVDLSTRRPLLHQLDTGTKMFRIYRSDRDPLFFGRTCESRFDAPDDSFGVLYLGMDLPCAFIEAFAQTTGIRQISRERIQDKSLAEIEILHPLRLIDLCTSGGLARIGADAGLYSGDHAVSQRWSAALRHHPTKPDGILYPARHDPARTACAIFDHPASTFRVKPRGSLLDSANTATLAAILDAYDFGLIA